MRSITITSVYQTLKDLGVVESQRDFSRYIGRKDSWYSSSVARHRDQISTISLLALMRKLDESIASGIEGSLDLSESPEDREAYKAGADELIELKTHIENMIECRIKSMLN